MVNAIKTAKLNNVYVSIKFPLRETNRVNLECKLMNFAKNDDYWSLNTELSWNSYCGEIAIDM